MSGRKQLYKEADLTSDANDRKAGLFTTKRCVLLLSAAAIILSLLSWQTWQSYKHIRTTETQIEQIYSLESSAMHHDEMLTMSAMMAAVTQNFDWEIRYRELDPRLKAVVKEIRRVFNINNLDAKDAEEGLSIFVDDKLDTMDNEALELMGQRKYNDAAILLQSPEYEEQKQAYNRGMKEFISNAQSVLKDRRDSHRRKVLGAFTAVNIILLVIALTWLVLYKNQKYHHNKKSKAQQEFDVFAHEWHKTFNAITDGVCIIDKSEGKMLQCNSAMTRFLKRPYDEIIGRSCCELLHNSSEPVNEVSISAHV